MTGAAMPRTAARLPVNRSDQTNLFHRFSSRSCRPDRGSGFRFLAVTTAAAAVTAEFDKNTEEAIAANVFGAPWYSVDGEGFWGQDRLEFVERALMGK